MALDISLDGNVLHIVESRLSFDKTEIRHWYKDILNWRQSSCGRKGGPIDRDMTPESIAWTKQYHLPKVGIHLPLDSDRMRLPLTGSAGSTSKGKEELSIPFCVQTQSAHQHQSLTRAVNKVLAPRPFGGGLAIPELGTTYMRVYLRARGDLCIESVEEPKEGDTTYSAQELLPKLGLLEPLTLARELAFKEAEPKQLFVGAGEPPKPGVCIRVAKMLPAQMMQNEQDAQRIDTIVGEHWIRPNDLGKFLSMAFHFPPAVPHRQAVKAGLETWAVIELQGALNIGEPSDFSFSADASAALVLQVTEALTERGLAPSRQCESDKGIEP